MELSPCCQAQVSFSGDGELYCKQCYGAVEVTENRVGAVVPVSAGSQRTRYEVHCLNDHSVYGSTFDKTKADAIAERWANADVNGIYFVQEIPA